MTLRITKFLISSGIIPAFSFLIIMELAYHVTTPFSLKISLVYWVLILTPIGIAVSPWYRRFEQARERKLNQQHD